MLLVSSCVPVITWLCSHVMRFQSRPINWPLLTIESPVAQWLEHPTRSRRVVGSNPIWGSDFFRVLQTFIYLFIYLFIHLFIYSFIFLLIYLLSHSFVCLSPYNFPIHTQLQQFETIVVQAVGCAT